MIHVLLAVVTTVFTLSTTVGAAETARQILDRRKVLEDTTRHWDDRHQRMKLTIIGGGSDLVRELDVYERKYPGDEQKAIAFILAPANLKGMGFLSFTHRGRSGEQWLYQPAYKQDARRLADSARNQSFVNTDFTYHDLDLLAEMPWWSEYDATSNLRGEEVTDGIPCHVIELAPRRKDIGYKHIVLWLGRDDLVPRQVEFYEQRPSIFGMHGAPTKRIRQGEVRLVGTIPVARRITFETPAAGTQTRIEITEIQFNQGLDDDVFTKDHLELGIK